MKHARRGGGQEEHECAAGSAADVLFFVGGYLYIHGNYSCHARVKFRWFFTRQAAAD